MFRITDRVARQLKAALSKANDPESDCFRMVVAHKRLHMMVDQERPGDRTIEHEGEALVVLDAAAGNLLCNRKLDFEEEATGLVLKKAE
jgi:hypothetical protein